MRALLGVTREARGAGIATAPLQRDLAADVGSASPMPMTQKEWIKLLQDPGWQQEQGGKHAVEMTKEGRRPLTLPMHKGQACSKGLDAAIRRQAGL